MLGLERGWKEEGISPEEKMRDLRLAPKHWPMGVIKIKLKKVICHKEAKQQAFL